MDAVEHFAFARERALAYVDRGEAALALRSFASDLNKHDGTASLLPAREYMAAAADGSVAQARRFIEGLAGPAS